MAVYIATWVGSGISELRNAQASVENYGYSVAITYYKRNCCIVVTLVQAQNELTLKLLGTKKSAINGLSHRDCPHLSQFPAQTAITPVGWFISCFMRAVDRPCGSVVRVPVYRSRCPGSIPGATRFYEK
jgi:hypothetical protein